MAEHDVVPHGEFPGLLQCLHWCAQARWKRLSRCCEPLAALTSGPSPCSAELSLSLSLAQAGGRWLQRHQIGGDQVPPSPDESRFDCGVRLAFGALALAEQFLLLDESGLAQRQVRRFSALIKLLAFQAGVDFHPNQEQELDLMSERLSQRLAVQAQARRFLGQADLQDVTFVLGMHRSGTSALAGLLCQAGLAAPADLMESNHVNPKGFFESQGLFELNESLLDDLDRDWMDVDPLPGAWFDTPFADRWRLASLEHLSAAYAKRSHALIKDPRYCLLLPGLADWWESGAIDGRFLIILRDPLEVAHSLSAAHPIGIEHALNLWLLYGFAAERATRAQPRLMVVFQQLMEQPAAVLARVLSFVSPTVAASITPDHLAQMAAFVDPSLHRQRLVPNQGLPSDASPSLRRVASIASQVYGILRDGATGEGGGRTTAAALARLEQLWILGRSTHSPQDSVGDGSVAN